MGKKAALKKIRKIAMALPALQMPQRVGEIVTAKEALKGIKQEGHGYNGTQILPGHTYRKISTKAVPVNHTKHMKRMYNRHGAAGVNQYIHEIDLVMQREQEKSAQNTDKSAQTSDELAQYANKIAQHADH